MLPICLILIRHGIAHRIIPISMAATRVAMSIECLVRVRVRARVRVRVRVRKLRLIDQDEAARSAGKGDERSTHRAREAGPPRRD